MPLRKVKPTSPGRRAVVLGTFDDITRKSPEKSLLAPIKKTGGRNAQGRMTVRHRGGGAKRRYRFGPKTTVRRITMSMKGRLYRISTILIMNSSVFPPRYPDSVPHKTPIMMLIVVANKLTASEILTPLIVRTYTSLPT